MLFKSVIVSSLVAFVLTTPLSTIQRREALLGPLGGGILGGATSEGLLDVLGAAPVGSLARRVEIEEVSSDLSDISIDLSLLKILHIEADLNLLTRSRYYHIFSEHCNTISIELGGNILKANLRSNLLRNLIDVDLNADIRNHRNKYAIANVLIRLGLNRIRANVHADILHHDLIDLYTDIRL